MRETVLKLAILWCVVATLTVLSGCKSNSPSTPSALPAIGSGLDKAQAHVESAERLVNQAAPTASATGKTLLSAASGEHAAAIISIKDGDTALAAATAQSQAKDRKIETLSARVTAVESTIGYRIEVWAKRIFWIITVSWVVLGGAAIALGMGNPLGWASSFGKEIVRFLPFANPFAWIRDAMSKWKTVAVVKAA